MEAIGNKPGGQEKLAKMKEREAEGSHKVRFEAPFHIRCKACNNMMAKGVRFNAIKKIGGLVLLSWKVSFY